MSTGISGSNTVFSATWMAGRSASVFAGSATSESVSWPGSGVGGGSCGIMGTNLKFCPLPSTFYLLPSALFSRRLPRLLERDLERVPGQARALHADGELAHPRERRQLAHVFHG